jgi:hypothetical protein
MTAYAEKQLAIIDRSLHADMFTGLFGKLLWMDEQNAKAMEKMKLVAKAHENVL